MRFPLCTPRLRERLDSTFCWVRFTRHFARPSRIGRVSANDQTLRGGPSLSQTSWDLTWLLQLLLRPGPARLPAGHELSGTESQGLRRCSTQGAATLCGQKLLSLRRKQRHVDFRRQLQASSGPAAKRTDASQAANFPTEGVAAGRAAGPDMLASSRLEQVSCGTPLPS